MINKLQIQKHIQYIGMFKGSPWGQGRVRTMEMHVYVHTTVCVNKRGVLE